MRALNGGSMSVTKTLAMVALTVVAAHAAHAAPAKSGAKNAKAPAQSVAASESADADGIEEASAPASASGETLMENNVPPSAKNPATSTANLSKQISDAKPRRVFGEFYTETNEGMSDVKAGTGTPELDAFAGVKYDFGNARSFSVRQNFAYMSAGMGASDTRGSGEFHLLDTALNYTDGKLASFMGDGTVILIARQYLPTGESTRFLTHNLGQTRVYLIESKTLGKWDLSLVQAGRYYETTQDSYFKDGKEAQNRAGIASVEADAFYNLNSVVAVGMIAGADTIRLRPLGSNRTYADDIYFQPTLQVVPAKGVTAQLYIYNEINTTSPTHDVALMREDETQVWANLSLTL
jgi:hypothetical protein